MGAPQAMADFSFPSGLPVPSPEQGFMLAKGSFISLILMYQGKLGAGGGQLVFEAIQPEKKTN